MPVLPGPTTVPPPGPTAVVPSAATNWLMVYVLWLPELSVSVTCNVSLIVAGIEPETEPSLSAVSAVSYTHLLRNARLHSSLVLQIQFLVAGGSGVAGTIHHSNVMGCLLYTSRCV